MRSGGPDHTPVSERRTSSGEICMMAGRWVVVGLGCAALVGCATIRPESKIEEAVDLVEQRIGGRPAWSAPWDELPPPWDGQTALGVDEAVVLSLRNNRELRADLEMIGKANADLIQAGLLQNPVINFMAMFPDGGGRSRPRRRRDVYMLESNTLNGPLNLSMKTWLSWTSRCS